MQDLIIKDRYRLEKIIGRGGMATVYKAIDQVLSRPVAVKILHNHFADNHHSIERFRREAHAAASLVHPNITAVYDAGYSDGVYYIVMEYVEGATLKQIIDSRAPLRISEAIYITERVAEALGYAHGRGIIHRDVKPQNILVTSDYVIKVTDFGIARAIAKPGITQTGKILGTARYISPEQARGQTADQRSDIYSLGVILYEMVTGRPIFEGSSSVDVAGKHVTEKPVRPREINPRVPSALEAVIDKLLQKNPNERYQDTAGILSDLIFWGISERRERGSSGLPEDSDSMDREPEGDSKIARGAAAGGSPSKSRSGRSGARDGLSARKTRRRRRLTPFAKILIALSVVIVAGSVFRLVSPGGAPEVPGNERVDVKVQAGKYAGEQVGLVKPYEAVDYDPDGDGDENPSEANRAYDNNITTAWSTEGYSSRNFGGKKSGVGVYIDYGKAVSLREMTVISSSGWSGAIKGSNDLLSWDILREVQDANKKQAFELDGGTYRFYLVWISKLPPASGDVCQGKIYEIEARGKIL